MVPIIEKDYILLLGIVFYIRNIILLGSTTTKNIPQLMIPACFWYYVEGPMGYGFAGSR